MNGNPVSHDAGPIAHASFGAETASIARTTSGSNCLPLNRTSSSSPPARVRARLYGRAAVIVSNESATATMRPASEICVPLSPRG